MDIFKLTIANFTEFRLPQTNHTDPRSEVIAQKAPTSDSTEKHWLAVFNGHINENPIKKIDFDVLKKSEIELEEVIASFVAKQINGRNKSLYPNWTISYYTEALIQNIPSGKYAIRTFESNPITSEFDYSKFTKKLLEVVN